MTASLAIKFQFLLWKQMNVRVSAAEAAIKQAGWENHIAQNPKTARTNKVRDEKLVACAFSVSQQKRMVKKTSKEYCFISEE